MIRAHHDPKSAPACRRRRPAKPDRRSGTDAPMGVAEIVSVCMGALLHELREFFPAARIAFPGRTIHIYTDRPEEASAIAAACHVEGLEIHSAGPSGLDLSSVATHSPYWHPEPIAWKLLGLRERVAALPHGSRDGVLLADCDITFRAGLERAMRGEVALSPFYWGRRSATVRGGRPLAHRDGEHNAGMLLTRSPKFCAWWLGAYLSGAGGFYEQACLDLAAENFTCDYFGPLHNWGKWRRVAPHDAVRSYHMHLREPAGRDDVVALKLAAQQAAASARALLARDPSRRR